MGKAVGEGGSMTAKEWLPLIGLAASVFILNTSEFMPIGLLVDIAADFGVSEAQAGLLVSVYAWAVMLLSLPLMIFASRFEFKRLLLGVLAVFLVGQAASGIAGDYWTLMAARLVVACAHAVFWSIASPMAVRVVAFEHRPLALGVIATGTSIAMIAGLPLGRMIGLALGWRMTFLCMAAVSGAVVAYLAFVFPRLEKGEPFALRGLPVLLGNPMLLALYATTLLMATAYYMGYSYIEPFLQQVAGMSDALITAALCIFGAAGIAGSALFARFYISRRFAFAPAAVGGIAASLALLHAASVSFPSVAAVCILWGACATAANVAFQSEIIKCVPENASPVAMSMFSGIFNLGIGTGTAAGGAVATCAGMGAVGYAGGAVGIAACALCALGLPWAHRRLEAMRGCAGKHE